MSIFCPYCDKDTGKTLDWYEDEQNGVVIYGNSFECPHCHEEIETEWETGMYDAVTDECSDGYGYARKRNQHDR